MSDSYKNEYFIKRMWHKLFKATKTIDEPLKYTQKEIIKKADDVLSFLSNRLYF